VAYGAAIQAAILTGKASGAASECLLIDVTPLSLGVESSGGVMAVIIPKNSTIPVTKSKTFSTNHDNQESVKIKIFEGERPLTRDNHCLGTFEMHGIPPMPRAQPRIEVTFNLDADGILNVTAQEKGSGKSGSLTITNDAGRLSPDQIKAMLDQAKAFEAEDRQRAELLDWRNSLENYAFNMKARLGEHAFAEVLTAEERESLSAKAEAALLWLDENDTPSLAELQHQLKELEIVYGPVVSAATARLQEKETPKPAADATGEHMETE
jgi:L1 cell adhesion molecule like protein